MDIVTEVAIAQNQHANLYNSSAAYRYRIRSYQLNQMSYQNSHNFAIPAKPNELTFVHRKIPLQKKRMKASKTDILLNQNSHKFAMPA